MSGHRTTLRVRPSRTFGCVAVAFGWLPGWRSRRRKSRRGGMVGGRPKGAA